MSASARNDAPLIRDPGWSPQPGPGSAAHRYTSLRAALRPGHGWGSPTMTPGMDLRLRCYWPMAFA